MLAGSLLRGARFVDDVGLFGRPLMLTCVMLCLLRPEEGLGVFTHIEGRKRTASPNTHVHECNSPSFYAREEFIRTKALPLAGSHAPVRCLALLSTLTPWPFSFAAQAQTQTEHEVKCSPCRGLFFPVTAVDTCTKVRPIRSKTCKLQGGGFYTTVALSIASAARKRGWKGPGGAGGAVAIAEAIAARVRETEAGGSEGSAVVSGVTVAANGFINFAADFGPAAEVRNYALRARRVNALCTYPALHRCMRACKPSN